MCEALCSVMGCNNRTEICSCEIEVGGFKAALKQL